jgi:hypothetical protein
MLIQSYKVRAGDPWPQPSSDIKSKHKITKWGTTLGGGGDEFTVPSKVPSGTDINPIVNYAQYDATTGSVNLYGNYRP